MYEVILSGPISGKEGYKLAFAQAQVKVHGKLPRANIWNPAMLPEGRTYKWYMRVCLQVILDEAAEGCVLVQMKGWNRSLGSVAEWAVARCLGMRCVEIGEL